MLDAVFISDLHLHPNDQLISTRFNQFIEWVFNKTQTLYILGDFFHVWPGDDGIDAWSQEPLARLKWLSEQGVNIYFMAGNRDFLVSREFARQAGLTLLTEPAIIQCGEEPVLLVHGDGYCSNDKAHQWLRKLTRNCWFPRLFLTLPLRWRVKIVASVRQLSQGNRAKSRVKPNDVMDVVAKTLVNHLQLHQLSTVIHGHTHKPGLTVHRQGEKLFKQYVLSDWDDSPKILCYHKSEGFHFIQMSAL